METKKITSTKRYRTRYKRYYRKNQTYCAKLSTICKLHYPVNGQNFVFNLNAQKTMTLETVLNNCTEFPEYAKLFNIGRVYAVRIQANYIDRPNYFHIYPVAIALLPNALGGLATDWNTVRGSDSCLMLNNTNCKMFRRLVNSKVSVNQLNNYNDFIIIAETQARPGDQTGNEWGIKIDVYCKFYGSKI